MAELARSGEVVRPLNVGVLLSGCGVFDGAEVQESTLALLALDRHGATSVCLAPDRPQRALVDHLSRQTVAGERNMLQESARIARGIDPRRGDVAGVGAGCVDRRGESDGIASWQNCSRVFQLSGKLCMNPGQSSSVVNYREAG